MSDTTLRDVYESADPATQAALVQSFVARLVSLHALDPHLLGPAGAGTGPYRCIEQELEQIVHDGQELPHDPLAEVALWLDPRQQAAACEEPVVLHRDHHPWNVLVDLRVQGPLRKPPDLGTSGAASPPPVSQ